MFPNQASEFLDPGVTLLVDKPIGWTSFDVVNKLRYALKKKLEVKKIKVGHAGTLDPLATGLLIICTGRKTKTIDSIQGLNKTYRGTIRLGATTASYDAETEVEETFPYAHITNQDVRRAASTFLGKSLQRPPMYSAIQKDGQRLYKLARKGITVEVPLREIEIEAFSIDSYDPPDLEFEVQCTKGTYIRSLAFDMGRRLENGAFLAKLVRTRIGAHSLENAYQLDNLIEKIAELEG